MLTAHVASATPRRTPNADLRVGEVVRMWYGERRIVAIEPYAGPLSDVIFAIARVAPAPGDFSLEIDGDTEVVS